MFTYNVGSYGFKVSTLRTRINQGASSDQMQKAFRMWIKGTKDGNKVVLDGLIARRNDEFQLFNEGDYERDYDYTY
ncbi:MAG: hypothetical protein KAX49_21010 [Halanaerobiales bacterium]|nr:hypothetical protein [Halanaerobiales bacterium]